VANFLVRASDRVSDRVKRDAEKLGMSISEYIVNLVINSSNRRYVPGNQFESQEKYKLYDSVIRMELMWIWQMAIGYGNKGCVPKKFLVEHIEGLNMILTGDLDQLIESISELDEETSRRVRNIVMYHQMAIGSMNMAPRNDITNDIKTSAYETRAILWGLANHKITKVVAEGILINGLYSGIKSDIVKEYGKTKEGRKGKEL